MMVSPVMKPRRCRRGTPRAGRCRRTASPSRWIGRLARKSACRSGCSCAQAWHPGRHRRRADHVDGDRRTRPTRGRPPGSAPGSPLSPPRSRPARPVPASPPTTRGSRRVRRRSRGDARRRPACSGTCPRSRSRAQAPCRRLCGRRAGPRRAAPARCSPGPTATRTARPTTATIASTFAVGRRRTRSLVVSAPVLAMSDAVSDAFDSSMSTRRRRGRRVGQRVRDPATDAAPGAGDDRDPAVERGRHRSAASWTTSRNVCGPWSMPCARWSNE